MIIEFNLNFPAKYCRYKRKILTFRHFLNKKSAEFQIETV